MSRLSASRRRRAAATFDGALALAREGQTEGFDALFRRVSSQLLAFARARGSADADAMVSECLLRVFGRVDDFEGDEAGFRAWCFAICRNLLIDEARHRDRRPTLVAEPAGGCRVVALDDTADAALSEIGAAELTALLATLTSDQREVIALRIVADLSIAEVAEIVEKPQGAVKALQHRALRTISKRINDSPVSLRPEATLS